MQIWKINICNKKATGMQGEYAVLDLPAQRHLRADLEHVKPPDLLSQDALIQFSHIPGRHELLFFLLQNYCFRRTYHHAVATAYAAVEVDHSGTVFHKNGVHLAPVNALLAAGTQLGVHDRVVIGGEEIGRPGEFLYSCENPTTVAAARSDGHRIL